MIKDSLNLCGLWKRTNDKGQEYFIGSFLGIKVLIFKNDKKGNEKAPDYRLVLAPKTEKPSDEPKWDDDNNLPF